MSERKISEVRVLQPNGRCIIRMEPVFKGDHSVGHRIAEVHRLAAQVLEDNEEMQAIMGERFQGCVYVTRDFSETGDVVLEAADWDDLKTGRALAEFVADSVFEA